MKKLLLFSALAFSSSLFAQSNSLDATISEGYQDASVKIGSYPKSSFRGQVINTIFQEDFSDSLKGVDGTWGTNDDWTTSESNPKAAWFVTNNYSGSFSGGPSGNTPNWFGNSNVVKSATASNGYAVLDADAYNAEGGNTQSNTFEAQLISPYIDFGVVSEARVRFSSAVRQCCSGEAELYVSVRAMHNGTLSAWTDFEVYQAYSIQANDEYNGIMEVDLTSALNSEPSLDSVQIRFMWPNKANQDHYFWMIDDVEIFEQPWNDLTIDSVKFGRLMVDYFSGSFVFFERSHYSLNQMDQYVPQFLVDEFELGLSVVATVKNKGAVDQPKTHFKVDVYDDNTYSSPIYTAYSDTSDLASGEMRSDTLYSLIPEDVFNSVGGYYIVVGAVSDSTNNTAPQDGEFSPLNNNDTLYFEVTDYVNARDYAFNEDILEISGGINSEVADKLNGITFTTAKPVGVEVPFNFIASETIRGVVVGLGSEPGSIEGEEIRVLIRDQANNVIMESEPYVLSDADKGKLVTVPLLQPLLIDVETENTTVVRIQVRYEGSSKDVIFAEVGESKARQINDNGQIKLTAAEATSLYTLDEENAVGTISGFIVIRTTSDPGVHPTSINENELGVTAYSFPNPATDNINIVYQLTENSDVVVSVKDVTGKTVATYNEGDQEGGSHTLNVNTSDLEAGVYFYTISAGKAASTKKFSVVR